MSRQLQFNVNLWPHYTQTQMINYRQTKNHLFRFRIEHYRFTCIGLFSNCEKNLINIQILTCGIIVIFHDTDETLQRHCVWRSFVHLHTLAQCNFTISLLLCVLYQPNALPLDCQIIQSTLRHCLFFSNTRRSNI